MEVEVWKDIKGYEGIYLVSSRGRIKSLERKVKRNAAGDLRIHRTRIMNLHKTTSGYLFWRAFDKKNISVHRTVVTAFIGPIPPKHTVNHKNGIKLCNDLSNLEIMSYSENHLHAFRILNRKPTNLGKFGRLHNVSKPIIQLDMEGNKIKEWDNARQASREEGFSFKHISNVCRGRQETHRGFKWMFKHKII
jgi:hypothetical protein